MEVTSSGDNSSFSFDVRAFRFRGGTNTVYFSCQVLICLDSDYSDYCSYSGCSVGPGDYRRRRRDVGERDFYAGPNSKILTVTSDIVYFGKKHIFSNSLV